MQAATRIWPQSIVPLGERFRSLRHKIKQSARRSIVVLSFSSLGTGGRILGFPGDPSPFLLCIASAYSSHTLATGFTLTLEVGRPKTAKKARCSYPECGPRHEVPVPISVPMRFGGACPSELHYPGQPDSTRVQRSG